MEAFELLLLLVCIGMGIGMWLLVREQRQSALSQAPLMEWLKSMSSSLQQSDKNMTDTLQRSYSILNDRLEHTARVMAELKLETGKFSEIGRSMQELQDFLNSPKLRGNIGERILSDLMAQVLPHEAFDTQYRFTSGDIVDAVIKTKAGLIPIDSKFPMENYVKLAKTKENTEQMEVSRQFVSDVKKHIKAISTKYIRTNEKTTDFALMYIPAEAIYYEIAANQPELSAYAQSLRVLPVSPSTFYAFLQTILVSFEGQRIAHEARTILANLRSIQQDSMVFNQKLEVLSKHVANAYHNMSGVTTAFGNLQTKIDTTRSLSNGIDESVDRLDG